jgi:ankyrin repeat protein
LNKLRGGINLPYIDFKRLIRKNSAENVIKAIKSGLGPYQKDDRENTLFKAAIVHGTPDMARACVEMGADPNYMDAEKKEISLFGAIAPKNTGTLRALIKLGADVNLRDERGCTPLMHAVGEYYCKTPTLNALLEAGADINARDDRGRTVLMWAARRGTNASVLSKLIKAGADVSARDNTGLTALMWAAAGNDPGCNCDVIAELIKAGADVNAKNDIGVTALMIAADNGLHRHVYELIENGADVNARDETGMTVLMWAAEGDSGVERIIETLINAGADAGARDNYGVRVLAYAAQRLSLHSTTFYEKLLSLTVEDAANPDISAEEFLVLCSTGTRIQVVEALKAGANPNTRYRTGQTALMLAAGDNYNPGVTGALIEGGADANARSEFGWTPLMSAACNKYCSPETVCSLLEAGTDVNAKNDDGETALLLACKTEGVNPGVISVLLNAGADVNAVDNFGISACAFANYYHEYPGKDLIQKMLIEAGARREKSPEDNSLSDEEYKLYESREEEKRSIIELVGKLRLKT